MKGVIFDFNGTLFLDHDKHVKAWNQISQLLRHCPITKEELFTKFNGVPNDVIISEMLAGKGTKPQIQKYSALKEEYYRAYCQKDPASFHLISGAYDYFQSLQKRHIPFTIASASIKENIDFFISSFHLDDYFDISQIVYDDGTYQNKVAMFIKAAHNIGVDISDCLIYEDSISGIQSAYEAGCHEIIVIDTAKQKDTYQKLPGVVRVISDLTEVSYDKSDCSQ